ncbi:MAG TPA: ABC transporter permease [Bacillota bacterium]
MTKGSLNMLRAGLTGPDRSAPGLKGGIPLVLAALPILSTLGALLVGAVLIAIAGINPLLAYYSLVRGALGNLYGFGETLTRFIPLTFCALSFVFAFRTGIFNTGMEGQFYVGALGGILVGTMLHLPPVLHVIVSIGVAFLFGAIWASIAGVLMVTRGSSEIINTIMLTYIAALFVDNLIAGPLHDPSALVSQTQPIAAGLKLPVILPGTRLHVGFILAIAAAILVYLVLWRSSFGYKLRAVGLNPEAARFAGMNVKTLALASMFISGGMAGVGGAVELMGTLYRLTPGFSPGYGFDAIGVAVLGGEKPLGVVLAALLFAVIRVGAGSMQRDLGVPFPLVSVIQGLIILFIVGGTFASRVLQNAGARRVGHGH